MSGTVLILAGGNEPSPDVLRALPPAAMCITADHGTDHARRLGIVPDLVVGDLDSVSASSLAWARDNGAVIERHPAAKNHTDLELALARAVDTGPDRIVVAAVDGDRFDHVLANMAVVASPAYASVPVDVLVEGARIAVVHDHRRLSGSPGSLVSLLPVGGDAHGVTTDGLVYPLADETLEARSGRGVSNLLVGTEATITLRDGTLLAVQPDPDIVHPSDPGDDRR
ncbi:MAG: thiamine diphosphokinase [Acidimicrobiales bacterium]